MIRNLVDQASGALQLVASTLLAVCGLRFAVWSVLWAIEQRAPRLPELAGATSSPVPVPRPSSTSVAPAVSVVPRGESARVVLSITAGPPRSDVYVNRVHVGQTPFLGETSCKTGEPVKIEIVPVKGPLISEQRVCVPGTIRIVDQK